MWPAPRRNHLGAAGVDDRAEWFLARVAKQLGMPRWELQNAEYISQSAPQEFPRVRIHDPYAISTEEIQEISTAFWGRLGAAVFECDNADLRDPHPAIALGEQLAGAIPTKWPIHIPNQPDGVQRIMVGGDAGPLGGTARPELAHQDGVIGKNRTAVTCLWMESAPEQLAATFVQNLTLLVLDLWRKDLDAFQRLFEEDAIQVINHREHTAVLGPVLGAGRHGPQIMYHADGDYFETRPGNSRSGTLRAFRFLDEFTRFGSNGSAHVYMDQPGVGILFNNDQCVHGRTAFRDGSDGLRRRVVATKAFSADVEYSEDETRPQWSMVGSAHAGRPLI